MKAFNKILIHVLFWVLSFFLFSLVFKISDSVSRIDFIFSGLFHISLFFGAYVNLALVSALFKKKRYILFALVTVVMVFTAVMINQFTFSHLANLLFPRFYLVSYFEFYEVGILVVVYMLITTLLKLSYSWFELQTANQRLALIEKEHVKSELSMLKSQLNPHFLFNSLNALYSLAMKGSEKTADAIVQLADILRYVIYQSKKDKVLLKDEIKVISDYIELQKFRMDPASKIVFNHRLHDENLEIAPLLMLPLVENSFKHGMKGDLCNTFVDIELHTTNTRVVFQISNSMAMDDQTEKSDKQDADNANDKGMGNDNIRHRLNLLYPGRHSLEVRKTVDSFGVTMILEL